MSNELPFEKKKMKKVVEQDVLEIPFNPNPNINNPFLVTSYAQPYLGDYATTQDLSNQSNETLSTILEQLSTAYNFDFTTYTLTISTIYPAPIDPTSTITMEADSLVYQAYYEMDLYSDGPIYLDATDFFEIIAPLTTISQDLEVAGMITVDTLNGTTVNINEGFFSTMTGSSLFVDNFLLSTLTVSSLYVDFFMYSSAIGSSINVDYLEYSSLT